MDPATKPSVVLVYFTYTNQTRKVIDAMAEVLRGRGCDVRLAAIEFTDPRYAGRFQEFPMPRPFRELSGGHRALLVEDVHATVRGAVDVEVLGH